MDVERLWRAVCAALEAHGWKLLTATALLFVARAKYREYAQRAHAERTLAAANDPTRVAVLQRETARIREAQQMRLAQTTAAPRSKLKAASSSTKTS